ncbi:MAG: ABC transporter ATP-binding protein, partial [Bacteroidetes bacterium]|nr:ABC transporter ATP-binding protein [Bacteroidota bacterium]
VIRYIGPNGAGKSTTVKILCGLISDFDGEAIIKGYNVKKNPLEVKATIGYIPELAELYDVLTPYEFLNIMGDLYNLPSNVLEDRMNIMLTAFGLQDNMHQRMDTFSKGMKQKVLITSGLIHNPDIIILDEPLSGLDANSVIIVKDLISRLAQDGKTIFYCSHMMDVVEKVSDKIVLINEGTVIANGTFAELQAQQGNESLETIFSHLTSKENLGDAASSFINALR